MINEKVENVRVGKRLTTENFALSVGIDFHGFRRWVTGRIHKVTNGLVMVLCLLTRRFIAVLSNFANDYGDHQKVSEDTEERKAITWRVKKNSKQELKWD